MYVNKGQYNYTHIKNCLITRVACNVAFLFIHMCVYDQKIVCALLTCVKLSLSCTIHISPLVLYFEKYHFDIFTYKNLNSVWYWACLLSNKRLSYLAIGFYIL